MDKTNISYNRKTRQWQLTGEIGEVLTSFPAGPDGRRDASIAQLEIEAPNALALALTAEKHWPQLNGRAIRAAQLVANNAILDGGHARRWRMRSQTTREIYTIHQLRDGWNCNCRDWRDGRAPTIRLRDGREIVGCKHIVAIQIQNSLLPTPWPPTCPSCAGEMEIKRRQDNGSGLPFWSCKNFPFCKGRSSFQPHLDDLAHVGRDGKEALYLSLERAQAAGLVAVTTGAQRRARQNALATAEYRQAVTSGEEPAVAAAAVDASMMSSTEYHRHYHEEI